MKLLLILFLLATITPGLGWFVALGIGAFTGTRDLGELRPGDWCAMGYTALVMLVLAASARRGMLDAVRAERERAGRCPDCGYDLRATPRAAGPKLDRCPECGRPTGSSAVKQPSRGY